MFELPALLEEKRKKHDIPDAAFRSQCVYDRIFVWQIAENTGDTYAGTLIHKSEVVKARHAEEAPRGVIVSAGLKALDALRSNGMDVGHTINFIDIAPFRKWLDDRKQAYLVVLRVGDIVASEDLAADLAAKKVTVEFNGEHVLSSSPFTSPLNPPSGDL